MKKILGVHRAASRHWVGDGFPVRSMFSYEREGQAISPFLLLDYAGPMHFAPGNRPRGVGEHPHRGFETVTIVYQGEVEHLDSTGGGGRIGPGDVQWMTAASGILHQEFHSEAFTRRGGTLEMVQLWVNLPAADKMSAPAYQPVLDRDIPAIDLPDGAGTVRVIAGRFGEHRGPARTHTPMDVWDLRLAAGGPPVRLALADGWTSMLVVLHGNVRINGQQEAGNAQLVLLDRAGDGVELQAESDSTVLVLHGEPIDEPVVGHGPFVMNTPEEIREAVRDFNSGRFGRLPA
ncbi:pirin family protein [Thioalkalivibrio paradoxus]|uniref:Quercetin 2,3-dioxygenase n=1 Tax=Thioalkalivibrio paradoxus ARh 1 TaxID=713585 RepID=W0DNW8_9GAMM|nr:pirin family protein [Thioalkalivibrio paradoxus]AHE98668.1 quercetin 2,3-dioxygenase [Thioalkalivibrio paradoxus ARh 1]